MKKILFILSFFWGTSSLVIAQEMKTLFIEAPDSVFPLLNKNLRVDCVDFLEAGMQYAVTNALEGKSTLVAMTPDYMLLETSSASTMEVKKLPLGDGFIICVVNTVVAEASDSRAAFFDSSWRPISAHDLFTMPAIVDFFTSQSVAEEFLDLCEIYLVSLKLSADNADIVAEYTMPSYMNKEDAEKVLPHLQKIVYRWEGQRFVKQ